MNAWNGRVEEKLNKWYNWGGRVLTADPILEVGISKYSVSFWLEIFKPSPLALKMNHKVENCLSAGIQFLLLEIKTLPACAGDLFYSS